ncbi:restriction endonuclease subunit S [Stenotrophomonas maltophilia]|nr:restriction endonuclease subunit S [Stenotrophomonas maltophilia]MBN4966052.1 restriction endonuclease subunit S [Stenotrophomonas maltophilia]
MEMRPGYKQTEVGVIPEDWEVSVVGHEFDVQLGKMLDAAKNMGDPKPYLGNRNVQWGKIDVTDLSTMRMTRSDLERFRLKRGDLLVCEGGDVGRAAIWDDSLKECYYQKALHRLRPLREFDSRLMVELLHQWSCSGILANYVTQTSIAHLPREKFLEVPLPVPKPEEQRAIATALSDMDALLDGLDRLIAKKRAIKQATMQQLLTGQIRLPGFNGEWEVKRLGDVLTIKHGKSQKYVEASDGSYPILATGGQIGLASQPIYDKSSVLIGRKGTINQPQYMDQPFWSVDTLFYSEMKKGNVAKFFYYRFCLINWMQYNEASGVPSLNARTIESIELSLPDPEEQTAIATILSDMDTEITSLEARHAKIRALKQAMMQELLTGRTRLV